MYIVHILAIDGQTARPTWLLFFMEPVGIVVYLIMAENTCKKRSKTVQKTNQNGTKNDPKR